jgi:hypothetical protein
MGSRGREPREGVFGKVRSKELRLNNGFDAIPSILHVSNQMKAVHFCIRFVINYVSLLYTILLHMFQQVALRVIWPFVSYDSSPLVSGARR